MIVDGGVADYSIVLELARAGGRGRRIGADERLEQPLLDGGIQVGAPGRERTDRLGDLLGARVNQVNRDQSTLSLPVLRLDDEMGQRTRDGINDDACQFPAHAVAALNLATNRELRGLAHEALPSAVRIFAM